MTALAIMVGSRGALAVPPYVTDDPEPVQYRHWEFYLAGITAHDAEGWTGTSPHVEVNYGPIPQVHLHVLIPVAYVAPPSGRARFGLGDIEFGAKWRFLQESEFVPQIGTFPLVEAPTGSSSRGLGNGAVQAFLPLWIQKTVGPVTTYGGGGVWFNAAAGAKTWGYLGWQAQWRMVEALAVGAEVFYETSKVVGGESEARFNVGVVLDVTDVYHIIGSAGRGFVGPNLFQAYLGWLITLGPDPGPESY